MKRAAAACCGDILALHFTREGINVTQHGRRCGYLLSRKVLNLQWPVAAAAALAVAVAVAMAVAVAVAVAGLLPARDEWHLCTCFWFTRDHLNLCL